MSRPLLSHWAISRSVLLPALGGSVDAQVNIAAVQRDNGLTGGVTTVFWLAVDQSGHGGRPLPSETGSATGLGPRY